MSVKLPPTEKLPLAVRKDVRDSWEAKKGDLTKSLSETLEAEWTLDFDIPQIHAYATSDYGKDRIGACLHEYVDDAIRRLKEFGERYGDEGLKELNTIAYAHVLTMDVDEHARVSYCGVDIIDGKLRIIFKPGNLGTNIYQACSYENVEKALNDAPAPADSTAEFSYNVRKGIRVDYEPSIEKIRARIAELVAFPEIKLEPNFKDTYEKLLAESKQKKNELDRDWEASLGNITKLYFEGLVSQLQWQKFEDDDLLQEGFKDVVDKGIIEFRLVDKLNKGSYNEIELKDGKLYIQTVIKQWRVNVDKAAEKLVDML